MKTQSCKSKGRRLQQAVAADMLRAFPHLEEDDVRSTSMGCGGEDVQLSPAARRVFPYSVECKNTEKLAIWSALEQCKANCSKDVTPLVIFKRNRSPVYATLPWAALLRLIASRATTDEDVSSRKRPRATSEIRNDEDPIQRLQRTCDRMLAILESPPSG